MQLTKRFSQSFQVLASYTFSKVIDDAPDATSVVVANAGDDAKVAQNTLQPNQERGLGVNDVRHRFVFSAVWDLNYAQIVAEPRRQGPADALDAFHHLADSIRPAGEHRGHGRSVERRQQ